MIKCFQSQTANIRTVVGPFLTWNMYSSASISALPS